MNFYCTTTPAMTHDILSYVSLTFLIAIFLLALRINSKLSSGVSNKFIKPNRSTISPSDSEESDLSIEVAPGTPFEVFLNEDPTRRSLGKKEQFAAYRDWRSQKGLNWK